MGIVAGGRKHIKVGRLERLLGIKTGMERGIEKEEQRGLGA